MYFFRFASMLFNCYHFTHQLQSVPMNVLEDYNLTSMTLEYRRECRQSHLLESLTSMKEAEVETNLVIASSCRADLGSTHLLRMQEDRAEIVRARAEWRLKGKNKWCIWMGLFFVNKSNFLLHSLLFCASVFFFFPSRVKTINFMFSCILFSMYTLLAHIWAAQPSSLLLSRTSRFQNIYLKAKSPPMARISVFSIYAK